MSLIPARRIRLKLDAATPTSVLDANATDNAYQQTPLFLRGNATDVEVGIFYDDEPADASDIAQLTLSLWYGSTLLLQKTVSSGDITATITADGFDDNTAQHAVFECTNTNLNFSLSDIGNAALGSVVDLYLEVTALMDDARLHTLGIGTAKLLLPRYTVGGTAEVADPSYLTADQIAALYQLHQPTEAAENQALFNPDDGENYRVGVRTIDGVPTLTLETTPE